MKQKESLTPSLTDNGGKRSVLESFEINWTLDLNTTTTKEGLEMVTCLLIVETLY